METTDLKKWNEEFDEVMQILRGGNVMPLSKGIYGNFDCSLAPYINFITIDALEPKDWTNGIKENSVFITFEINQQNKSIEIFQNGHIYISDKDKTEYPQYKWLAMHSMLTIAKANKCKGIRKATYKDAKDCAKRIINAFNNVMEFVSYYTEGYPYKKGVNTIKRP